MKILPHKENKTNSLIKQLIFTIVLGISLLIIALFASGILFTGVVVQNTNSAIEATVNKLN
jgi:hypothetical protein